MAGHSKWHNIKRTKGAQDAKRGSLFSKLSRNIYSAAKLGGGDIQNNSFLRDAIDKAKSFSMPNDKIENAINKAIGKLSGSKSMLEKTYEIYGADGEATFLVECYTDNPNRTLNEIKEIAYRNNAKIVPEGSISWQYKNFIRIILNIETTKDIDELILHLLGYNGVEDIIREEEGVKTQLIILGRREESTDLIRQLRERKDIKISEAEMIMLANESIKINTESYSVNEKFIEQLEELEDVSSVWNNIEGLN